MTAERNGLSPAIIDLFAVVDSVDKLMIVALLEHRPGETWTTPRLADELRLATELTQAAVEELRAAGVVQRDATMAYKLAPPSEALRSLVELFTTDPVTVFRGLNEAAMLRVRGGFARVFSDAFLLRPRKPKGSDDG